MRGARFYLWIAVSLLAVLVVALSGSARGQAGLHPAISVAMGDDDYDSDQPIKDQQTIRKSFTLPAGERSLEVDNVTGFIEVTGSQTDQVQVVVNETMRAESKEKLEKAHKEVSLDVTQDGGALKLYVNGPFRCHDCCCSGCGHQGYSVRMDFQLQVPHNIALKLKTVSGGHVQVKDVTGNYDVRNVNGGIEMEDIGGSGTARTVNGGVKVTFSENPRQNSDFASVNGSIELYFAQNLSADFRFKTMNGGIFTDFPMTTLPARVSQEERHDGKFVFRTDRFTGGRIGSGGPEIKAETVNGSIRILERQ
jgi:DUF4097 and DUF4098 domain-containing protein YvlB